jgi:hypothetical protein
MLLPEKIGEIIGRLDRLDSKSDDRELKMSGGFELLPNVW